MLCFRFSGKVRWRQRELVGEDQQQQHRDDDRYHRWQRSWSWADLPRVCRVRGAEGEAQDRDPRHQPQTSLGQGKRHQSDAAAAFEPVRQSDEADLVHPQAAADDHHRRQVAGPRSQDHRQRRRRAAIKTCTRRRSKDIGSVRHFWAFRGQRDQKHEESVAAEEAEKKDPRVRHGDERPGLGSTVVKLFNCY